MILRTKDVWDRSEQANVMVWAIASLQILLDTNENSI